MPKGNWQFPRYLCRCVGHVLKNIYRPHAHCFSDGVEERFTVQLLHGAKRYSADLEQGGLEVPCVLKFVGDGEILSLGVAK